MFVDPDTRRIFVRREDGAERYLPYDLLVGADGIRSAVRAGLVANHRDFDCSVSDIFAMFKSVHVTLNSVPPALDAKTFAQRQSRDVLPQCLPGINAIALPETGGKINLTMGYWLDTPCAEALHSADIAVVAAFFQATFKAFELPWDEFARQWVGQAWSQTGQVHCNFYHSNKLRLLIMGDAAHGTSPSIGQGMNIALADAAALDELLDAHTDALDQVLPAFSEARVKEGNALTEISAYAFSRSPAQALRQILAQMVRGFLSKHLGPSLVAPEPMNELGMGAKLSEMYAELVRIGRLPAVRAVNDATRRRHFELRTGMVKARPSRLPAALGAASALAGLAAGVAALMATQAVSKPLMEPAGGTPLLEVCGDPHKFAASGLHAFEPMLGGSFVCLITQFLHALVLEPAGLLSWGLTIGLALPVSVLWNAEAGRTGASGLVRWPTLLGLLGQFLGISVVFPALWLPAAWYGKGDGAVSPARAYASIALAAPFISLTVALFALDPTRPCVDRLRRAAGRAGHRAAAAPPQPRPGARSRRGLRRVPLCRSSRRQAGRRRCQGTRPRLRARRRAGVHGVRGKCLPREPLVHLARRGLHRALGRGNAGRRLHDDRRGRALPRPAAAPRLHAPRRRRLSLRSRRACYLARARRVRCCSTVGRRTSTRRRAPRPRWSPPLPARSSCELCGRARVLSRDAVPSLSRARISVCGNGCS